jgi:cell wall-associated NlpC family hydrolase
MVGRLSKASLTPLAVAILAAEIAAAQPVLAQSRHLLLTSLAPLAPVVLARQVPPVPPMIARPLGLSPAPAATLAEPLPGPADPAAALAERLDSLDSSALPVAPAPAPSVLPDPAVFRDPALESGEYGIEYALAVRGSDSFLGRLSTHFKRLVEQAMTYLGTPYRRGGTSRRGLDCSGLVGAVYGQQGLEMPRTAVQQFAGGSPVAAGDLRPGDLVFFRDTYKRGISHVGIYIGEGRFIHAAGHRQGVIVSELSRPYYRNRFAGARRPASQPPAAGRGSLALAEPVAADLAATAATSATSPAPSRPAAPLNR